MKTVIIVLLLLLPIALLAQSKWGYGYAVSYHVDENGLITKYLFVSKLKDIDGLSCLTGESQIRERIEMTKICTDCLIKWFNEKVKKINHQAVNDIKEEEVYGDVGALPLIWLKKFHRKNATHLDSLEYADKFSFMTKHVAIKKRDDLIQIAKKSGHKIVVVR